MGQPMPTPDKRLEKVIEQMAFTDSELQKLWKVFAKHDKDGTGTMDVEEFYGLVNVPPSVFADNIFVLIETRTEGILDFSEFVETLSTFCLFAREDILKYCFYVFDQDKNGYIEQEELEALVRLLHQNEVSADINIVLGSLDTSYDGRINFAEFIKLNDTHPGVLRPAFRLQANMMMFTLGKKFWLDKRDELAGARDKLEAKRRKLREEKRKRLRAIHLKEIKAKMGKFQYYCNCPKRKKLLLKALTREAEAMKRHLAMIEALNKEAEDAKWDIPDANLEKEFKKTEKVIERRKRELRESGARSGHDRFKMYGINTMTSVLDRVEKEKSAARTEAKFDKLMREKAANRRKAAALKAAERKPADKQRSVPAPLPQVLMKNPRGVGKNPGRLDGKAKRTKKPKSRKGMSFDDDDPDGKKQAAIQAKTATTTLKAETSRRVFGGRSTIHRGKVFAAP